MLLYEAQLVRAEVPFLIYVCNSSHERAQDELGVVLGGENTQSLSTVLLGAASPLDEPHQQHPELGDKVPLQNSFRVQQRATAGLTRLHLAAAAILLLESTAPHE